MKSRKHNTLIASFVLTGFIFQLFGFTVSGQLMPKSRTLKDFNESDTNVSQDFIQERIAPDLREQSDQLQYGFRSDENLKVIIQLKAETNLNELFGNDLPENDKKQLFAEEVSKNKINSDILQDNLKSAGGRLKKSFNNLGLVAAELPLSKIKELSEKDEVAYISPDRETTSFGHLVDTTGYWNAGIYDKGDTNPSTWLDGGNQTIAVIDSGIDSTHTLMQWEGVGSKVWKYDFTGQGITSDIYGHGTHVASMFGAQFTLGNGTYQGLAAGSQIISLRALKSDGKGSVSYAIAALDWAVQQKLNNWWNIRVINMSLGSGPKDSYINDPLCQAARRAVNAGIVVVASAGNYGKDAAGQKIYGGISSPGIEPSVITVGAANTFGTNFRSDDTVATFSSRGPTRGYRTLSNGARKYDNLIKPDLIAPGNKIIGARSTTTNNLILSYPQLATGNATNAADKVMYLSGTSMAAPVVAGAAALLIQTNPKLTPNLIKAILMYSAQPLKNFNTLEQGAGELNIDGAVRLARLVKATLPTSNGAAMLTGSLPSSQRSSIAGQYVYWGKGIVTNFGFLYGNDLMVKYQGMYGNGVLMSDSTPFSGSLISRSTSMTSGTLTLYQGVIKNNGVLMSDGTNVMNANSMAGSPAPYVNSQGVLMSDGVLISDGVLMSDGVLISDNVADFTLGDNTSCMQPAP